MLPEESRAKLIDELIAQHEASISSVFMTLYSDYSYCKVGENIKSIKVARQQEGTPATLENAEAQLNDPDTVFDHYDFEEYDFYWEGDAYKMYGVIIPDKKMMYIARFDYQFAMQEKL